MPKVRSDKRTVILRTVILLVIVFIVGAVVAVKLNENRVPASQDASAVLSLAECLTQKGVKMYGAYWCSHCAKQKKEFGEAFAKIDYVECAVTGQPNEQVQACKDAGIKGYPTWTFPDGSRQSGEVTFQDLAGKSGCPFTPAAVAAP